LTRRDGAGIGSAAIGVMGERIARAWLRANGAKVLYHNFKAPRGGEVDIVAREGRLLLFTEVKTRRAGGPGRPLDAVDREKEKLIERGANEWLRLLGTREIPWRFDVIEVILTDGEKPRVHRVENAF
jgi:putative endonuclease